MFCPGLFEIRPKLHCHQPKIKPFLNRGITTKCLLSRSPGQNILKFWFSIWFFIPKKEFYSVSHGKFFLNQLCFGTSVGSNRKIPNLEPPEPLVNRTSNLPNLFLDFKTEPNLKRPNLEPLLILKKWLFWPPGSQIFAKFFFPQCLKIIWNFWVLRKRSTFLEKNKNII